MKYKGISEQHPMHLRSKIDLILSIGKQMRLTTSPKKQRDSTKSTIKHPSPNPINARHIVLLEGVYLIIALLTKVFIEKNLSHLLFHDKTDDKLKININFKKHKKLLIS